MKTIVQKYGGKLVADKEKMRKIAQIIASTYDEGNRVVVTISAMGIDIRIDKKRYLNLV